MLTNKKIVLIGNCGGTETSSGKSCGHTNSAWHTADCAQAMNISPGFQISGGEDPKRRPLSRDSRASILPALFGFEDLSKYTSFGRSRIYQLIADPDLQFPPPVKIGKSSRWLKTEVDSWLSKQAAARQQVVAE